MSKQLDVAIKIAEEHVDREVSSKLAQRMSQSVQDAGGSDSLRHMILGYVASEQYDRASEQIDSYMDSKKEYPQFGFRCERYVAYSKDLILAVKAKRSFPGSHFLSMSKQQELLDRAMAHFEDLKVTLKKVEQIEREVRLEDVRSTIYVVRAAVYCVFVLLVIGFVLEAAHGILPTAWHVLDETSGDASNWIFDKLGW